MYFETVNDSVYIVLPDKCHMDNDGYSYVLIFRRQTVLTEEQRLELKEEIERRKGNHGAVAANDLAEFPASCEEITIPTSLGITRVVKFEHGEKNDSRPAILNFHGGGFVAGRNDRDELFCRRMACLLDALVLDVDYKLAPDYPYPTAVTESWEVAEWMWKNRVELRYHPNKVVLMGHSAGGNLVAGICMRGVQEGLFKPCCAVLDYPPLDLVTNPAEKQRTSCDMPAERAREYNRKYISPEQGNEPYASPIYAPIELLEEFPDILIISAGEDSLCWEAEEFALKLMRAGVVVTAKRFTESIHGFVINRMCEWQDAIKLMTGFIETHVAQAKTK